MDRTSREIEKPPCEVCEGRGWYWVTSPWLLVGLSILCLAGTIFLGRALREECWTSRGTGKVKSYEQSR